MQYFCWILSCIICVLTHTHVKANFTQLICNLTYFCTNIYHFLVPPMGHYVSLSSPTQVKFGATYLSPVPMPLWTGRHLIDYRDPVDLHNIVSEVSDYPNYIYPRIPVHSELNIARWRFHLADYYDQQLVECLEFGFPVGIHPRVPLESQAYNHSPALQYICRPCLALFSY